MLPSYHPLLLLHAKGREEPAYLVRLAMLHRRRGDTAAAAAALVRAHAPPHRHSAEGDAAAQRAAALAPPPTMERIAAVRAVRVHVPASLLTLELTHLELRRLPEEVTELRLLQRLDVSHNALCTLPESVGTLRQLRELLASANNLSSLPLSLASLPQRSVLRVVPSPPLRPSAPPTASHGAPLRAEIAPAHGTRPPQRAALDAWRGLANLLPPPAGNAACFPQRQRFPARFEAGSSSSSRCRATPSHASHPSACAARASAT